MENIHLSVLPPHSSHCFEPLDVSVFSPFKKNLNTECRKFLHANPNRVIVKEDMPQIIGSAFKNFMTVSTIMLGYRKIGIFPFHPSVPYVTPPVVNKVMKELKVTRKEQKDNGTVKILFQEKSSDFNKLKDSVEPRIKKCTFVPPYGAAITEDTMKKGKQWKQRKKQNKIQEKKEKTGTEKERLKSCKRALVFTPLFSLIGKSSCDMESEIKENDISENLVKSQIETKERLIKKGRGPLPNSRRGKAQQRK